MEKKRPAQNQLYLNFTSIGVAADAIMKNLLAGAPTLAGKGSSERQILNQQTEPQKQNDSEKHWPEQNDDHIDCPLEFVVSSMLAEHDPSQLADDKDDTKKQNKVDDVVRSHAYPPPVPAIMQAALEATLRGRRHSPPWPSLNAGRAKTPQRKRGRE